MSTLGKIREKSGLLVTILAIALGLFILQSALESGNSFFMSGRNVVGEISGEKIKIDEFQRRVEVAVENEKARTGTTAIDENTLDMLRQQTWNQLVHEKIMTDEYKKLGITVTTDELFDMVQGPNPHPSVKQAFTDPNTGTFDRSSVVNFLKNMDKDETGATRQRWLAFESAIKAERLNAKYNNLVKSGLYVTKAQAKQDYLGTNKSVAFKYVLKRYDSVADSTIKLTDKELSKYYNENKGKFKQETSRSLDYVVFDVTPSAEDREAAMEWISKLKDEFRNTKEDSVFVNMNSDAPYNPAYYKKGNLSPNLDTIMFNSEPGVVVGPYMEGESFKLAKLIEVKMVPDSVKARHILIKGQNGDNKKALAKADSLKRVIKAGGKFDEIAKTVSEDVGSATKGGDLGWFKEGQMVKPFNDAAFNGKKGDMPIVESQFGVHLIEILDKGPETKKVKVAFIERRVEPSTRTFQAAYAKASEFAGKNTTQESFNKAIQEQGLNKRIADNVKENDRNLPGVEGSRELIKWAFTAEQGQVSKVFEFGNKYVVASLRDVKEKGTASLDQVKEQVETEARREKKAEMFTSMINNHRNSAKSLEQLAQKLNTTVTPVDNQVFNTSFIPGVGREAEVVGQVFALKQGQISEPLKGETGVYVVQVINVKPAPEVKDLKANKTQIASTLKSRVDYEMFEALKDKAEVEDNRAKFY